MLNAPWSDDVVRDLNEFQTWGMFHPYTCGTDSRHRELVATNAGWMCLDCDYKQDWCHGQEGELMRANHAQRRVASVEESCKGRE